MGRKLKTIQLAVLVLLLSSSLSCSENEQENSDVAVANEPTVPSMDSESNKQVESGTMLLASAESKTGDAPAAGSAPVMPNPHAMPGMTPHQFTPYANPMMGMAPNMYTPNMYSMMNPSMYPMTNPAMYMNMMSPMMSFLTPMMSSMNPQYHGAMMNMMATMFANPTVDAFTRVETLDSMMRMMDPKLFLAMMGGTYEKTRR